ncbi:MAG: YjbQ family protein [Candidatus Sulfotelmatobacter sp.]
MPAIHICVGPVIHPLGNSPRSARSTTRKSHGNGHSHLQATLLGPSLTVPIPDGKLVLGTWQQIFHLECDVRGRERTIIVIVIGDLETIPSELE